MAETKTIEAIVAEKGKKRAREEQTPVDHRRKAKSVAVTDEGGTSFAHIVGFFVISSKKREPINGTHAGIAAAIITSNGQLQHAGGAVKSAPPSLLFTGPGH